MAVDRNSRLQRILCVLYTIACEMSDGCILASENQQGLRVLTSKLDNAGNNQFLLYIYHTGPFV